MNDKNINIGGFFHWILLCMFDKRDNFSKEFCTPSWLKKFRKLWWRLLYFFDRQKSKTLMIFVTCLVFVSFYYSPMVYSKWFSMISSSDRVLHLTKVSFKIEKNILKILLNNISYWNKHPLLKANKVCSSPLIKDKNSKYAAIVLDSRYLRVLFVSYWYIE